MCLSSVVAMKMQLSERGIALWHILLSSDIHHCICGRTCFPQAAPTFVHGRLIPGRWEISLMGNSVLRTPHWPCWAFSELHSGLGLFCSTFLPSFSQGRPASQSDGSHPLLATSPFPLRGNSLNYFLDILSWPLLFGGPRLTQISPFPCKLLLLIFRPVNFIHMLSCSSNSSFFFISV